MCPRRTILHMTVHHSISFMKPLMTISCMYAFFGRYLISLHIPVTTWYTKSTFWNKCTSQSFWLHAITHKTHWLKDFIWLVKHPLWKMSKVQIYDLVVMALNYTGITNLQKIQYCTGRTRVSLNSAHNLDYTNNYSTWREVDSVTVTYDVALTYGTSSSSSIGSLSAWMLSMAVECATNRCLLIDRDRLRAADPLSLSLSSAVISWSSLSADSSRGFVFSSCHVFNWY
jgi:hypothetical protein